MELKVLGPQLFDSILGSNYYGLGTDDHGRPLDLGTERVMVTIAFKSMAHLGSMEVIEIIQKHMFFTGVVVPPLVQKLVIGTGIVLAGLAGLTRTGGAVVPLATKGIIIY